MNQKYLPDLKLYDFKKSTEYEYNELRIIYLLTSNENSFRIINKEIIIANL